MQHQANDPHAAIERTTRAELVESSGRRWSLTVAPAGPYPSTTASFELRFARPAVLEMISGCDLPRAGYVTIDAPASVPIGPPAAITGMNPSPSTSVSFNGGVSIRIAILDGIVHPVLLSVPIPLDTHGHMELRVAVQQQPSPEPQVNYCISLTGRFVD